MNDLVAWNERYEGALSALSELLDMTEAAVERDLLPDLVGLQYDGLPPSAVADRTVGMVAGRLRHGLSLDRLCHELPPLLARIAGLFDELNPASALAAQPEWARPLGHGATAH